jgi:hypothetical protein
MVIEDEEDLILELTIKLPDNIQMKRGLTFIEYVEDRKPISTLQLEK